MTLSIKSLAVIFLVASIVAFTVAMLLVPGASWAAIPEWLWTQMTAPGPCACMQP